MDESNAVGGPKRRKLERRVRVEGGRRGKHTVRTTEEEEGRLLLLAQQYGVSVPKLLVDSTLSGVGTQGIENASVRKDLIVQLFGMHRQLAGIANNVNQIAKATNATREAQAGTAQVLAKVRETAERIDDLVDRLGDSFS